MSDPNTVILQRIGNDLVTNVVCTTVHTILIAIYTVLVFKAASILLRIRSRKSGRNAKSPIILLVAVFTMWIIALTTWTINLVNIVGELRMTLVKDPDLGLDAKYARFSDFSLHRIAVIGPLFGFMTCIGDGIIIWRAYAFWAASPIRFLAIALPLISVLGSIVCSSILGFCVGRLGGALVLGTFENPAFCRKVQTASYVFPAATTAIATTLIIIRVWSVLKHSRANRKSQPPMSRTSKLEDVVILLIETGVAYFLFFLAQAILIAPAIKTRLDASPSLTFAGNLFSEQTSSIVGMYPTIIICLVHTNHSAMDTTLFSTVSEDDDSKASSKHEGDHITFGSFPANTPDRSLFTSGDLESRGQVPESKEKAEEQRRTV